MIGYLKKKKPKKKAKYEKINSKLNNAERLKTKN